ncbi:MAG TPA: AAA family ATPase [Balneolales bacterium]|nr:AAA family ATPase [Balneolales bacterium]
MKRIAFINQKGGVGKTTSVVNVGAALSLQGYKVLMIDMDPQANLTYSLRMAPTRVYPTIYQVMKGQASIQEAIIKHENIDIIPSSIELSGAEMELVNEPGREMLLRRAINGISGYDYVLIDCPPNLGLLTLNAFTAVKEVFIVLQSEYLALHGLSKLLDVVKVVKERLNNEIEVTGVICTLFDKRKNLNKEVVGHIKEHFGSKVFKTIIRDNVALAEAPSFHKTIFEYDEDSYGAEDYMSLSKEITNGYLNH